MNNLFLQHNIYLTREQRYSLHQTSEVLMVIGVSMPVWEIDGEFTEPGLEVFCNYYLGNPKVDTPIKILKDGYSISLPHQIPPRKLKEINNEDWLNMSQEQREIYYTAMPNELSSVSLLDVADGGSGTLIYQETNKVHYKNDIIRIIHYVNIWDMKYLKGSLICGTD